MTEIRLLGPLEVLVDGGTRLVGLDRLVAVAWDTDPPSTARHQIQKSIASLRAALGPSVIVTDGAAYRVVAEFDASLFEDRVRSAAVLDDAAAAAAGEAGTGRGDLPAPHGFRHARAAWGAVRGGSS